MKNLEVSKTVKFALLIEYDGNNLVGWQKQNEGISVQGSLEEAAKNIFNQEFEIQNTDRAVGTRISYHLYKKFGNNKLDENSIELNFKGSAGQSFGAFAIKGLKLTLKGDANDYVAKGLSGGTLPLSLTTCTNDIFDAFLGDDLQGASYMDIHLLEIRLVALLQLQV